MSDIDGDIKENGHTILLMEPQRNERTYSDYPNLLSCLESMIEMYHESCEGSEGQDLDGFFKWIDDFYMLKLFSFDGTISRYRMKSGPELKKLFEENDANNDANQPIQNGNGDDDSTNCTEQDMEESDDDENWDS